MPDVLVVGGGHNGLICAAYLARAGLDTVLVEARPEVGGCASTVTDLDARFNICNCDHSMIRGMPMVDELDLATFGLRYVEPEISGINQFYEDAAPWLFLHDTEAHLEALAQTYPTQVAGYRRYLADAMPVAALAIEMARTKPSAVHMTRSVLRKRAAGASRLLRWSRMSQLDVLRQYFDDWHLIMPAVTSGPTVWGVPPETPGTGMAAALYATRHTIKSGRPVGGSGALTDAARRSFEAAGGVVRCNSKVGSVIVRDGGVRGIRLVDGTEIDADVVVAACDPHLVFCEWLDNVPPAARRLAADYRSRPQHDGYESKVDGVLTGLPTYRDQPLFDQLAPGVDTLAPTTLVSPNPAELAEAHQLRASGHVAAHPSLLINVPSVLDTEMQPHAEQHVLSLEVLFTPYALHGGWPDSSEPARWLGLVEDLMQPGTLQLDRWRSMTPDRYETEFHMPRGHTPSYAGPPLRAFFGRHPETTRYRAPIDGLYLSGAGTFPGAGVFGASGRNAADAVITDRSRPGAVRSAKRRLRGARRSG